MSTAPRATSVLLCTDSFQHGGSQAQLVALANALALDPRWDVHVCCLRREGPLLPRLEIRAERIREFRLRRFYDASGFGAIASLAAYVARRRFALVHAQDFYANLLCTAACAWLPRVKLLVSRRYEVRSRRRLHHWGERWCYRLADAVIVNARTIAARLVEQRVVDADKIAIIPNGIDASFYRDRPSEPRTLGARDACRLGVVGRLVPIKGHAVLLDAVALLAPRWPCLEAVFVGDGELRAELIARAATLGLRDRVRFVGDHADVRPWIASFDLALLPSLHEGLPNALLEYFAMGRPVIATAVGGVPDIARHDDNAVLVPPGDAGALAASIDALLRDVARRAALGAAARRRAAAFRMDRMIARMSALYEQLLGGNGRTASRAPVPG